MRSTKDPIAGLPDASQRRGHGRFRGVYGRFVGRRLRRLGNRGLDRLKESRLSEVTLRVAFVLCLTSTLTLVVAGRLPWHTLEIEENDLAPRDVRAPRSARFVNDTQTERMREDAANNVPKVYEADLEARFDTIDIVDDAFTRIREARLDGETPLDQRVAQLQEDLPPMSREVLVTCLTVGNESVLDALHQQAREWIDETYTQHALHNDTDDLKTRREQLIAKCNELPIPKRHRDVLEALIRGTLTRPNLIFDAAATMREREAARSKVSPVYERVREGQLLLREGMPVSAGDLRRLESVGLYARRSSIREVTSTFGLVICFVLVLGVFALRYVPEVWSHPRLWVLVGILLVLGSGVHKLGIHLGWPTYVAIPIVATTGMLLSVLLDVQLAVIAAAFLALLLGAMSSGEVWVVATALASALIGIYCVGELKSRTQLVRTGLILAAVNVVLAAATGTLSHFTPEQILNQAGFGVIAGIGCAILTLGGATFLERPFQLTTDLRLLELSNPNEQLLRRLLVEAPGTYHASIIIANLAETAADAIGADSLLVRVGCYYHDIGKIRRPHLFVENQFGSDNPHDKMSPSLSVLAIQAHVKDGLEMGRRIRLPQPVLDIIAQHHGTSLVSYFYRQALSQQADDPPEESSYRYPGPKPQTRAAAVVMLADGVEAAVRALPNPTPNAVEERIQRVIRDRLEDGQLNDCDLTLRDLAVIEDSFARIMTGILHKRIEYPSFPQKALPATKRKQTNGSTSGRDQQDAAAR